MGDKRHFCCENPERDSKRQGRDGGGTEHQWKGRVCDVSTKRLRCLLRFVFQEQGNNLFDDFVDHNVNFSSLGASILVNACPHLADV